MLSTLVLITFLATTDAVVISTSKGRVRGYTSNDAGRFAPVHVFKGVPLARPPIGDLRFELPEDTLPWEGVLDTMEYSPACPSNTTRSNSPQKNMSEDCLYVNIFADSRCLNKRANPCPVITYIHGGSFSYDSAVMFNDSHIIRKFASHEMVFVIPAYRLGIFGFLDLGNDDAVKRNIGMYDLVQDLKWIRTEIGNFGGDVNRITLMGNSAGAAATLYLMMTPSVPAHAFHQAILLSNAPDFQSASDRRITTLITENVGCNNTDWTEERITACLKEKPGLELLGWQRALEEQKIQSFDGPAKNTPLFPGTYEGLLRKATPRPLIFAVTKYEFEGKRTLLYKRTYCDFYCRFFEYHTTEAFDECMRFYTSDEYSGEYSVEAEAIHAINYRDAMIMQAKGAPVYLSSFELRNHNQHANDLMFAMGVHRPNRSLNEEETFMDQYYPRVIRNFAKLGRPAEEWLPLPEDGKGYFVFDVSKNGSEVIVPHQVDSYFYPQHVQFWLKHLAEVNKRAIEKNKDMPADTQFLGHPLVGSLHQQTLPDSASALAEKSKNHVYAFWIGMVVILILAVAILVLAIACQIANKRRAPPGYQHLEDRDNFGNNGKSGAVFRSPINSVMLSFTSVVLFALLSFVDAVVVSTSKGRVRGYTSYDAGPFAPVHVFKSVPLARAPIGDLRFELPEDALPWDGVLNTTEYSPACPSNSSITHSPQENISEDCLYVNIFADRRCFNKRTNPCPVLTYIHGGDFSYDSAVMFNDSQIIRKYASQEMVFVIPAYRLGIFGFLDLGNDDTVKRNIGMYDLVHDMKWISREIENFGGDPTRVTVLGDSAGAAATLYLMMTPSLPSDAFQQAILLSNDPDFQDIAGRRMSTVIIENVGCNDTHWTDQQIVTCLKEKPGLELLGWQRELEQSKIQSFEGPSKNTLMFPGTYEDLLRNAPPKPLIVGVTKYEFKGHRTVEYKQLFCDLYCRIFDYHTTEAFDECMRFYTSDEYSGEYSVEAEAIHAINYRDAMIMQAKGSPVYLSSFELRNHNQHANDLLFLLGLHPPNGSLSEEETFMDHYYPAVIRNFVNSGQPSEEWLPLTNEGNGYFAIDVSRNGSEVIIPHQVDKYFYPEHVHFWLTHLAEVNKRATEKNKHMAAELKSLALASVGKNLRILPDFASASTEQSDNHVYALWTTMVVILIIAASILVLAIACQITHKRPKLSGYQNEFEDTVPGYRQIEDMEIFGYNGKSGVVIYGTID